MSNRKRISRRGPRRHDVFEAPGITWDNYRTMTRAAAAEFGPASVEHVVITATGWLCLDSPTGTTTWGEITDLIDRLAPHLTEAAKGSGGNPQAFRAELLARAYGMGGAS